MVDALHSYVVRTRATSATGASFDDMTPKVVLIDLSAWGLPHQ
jgi:hypothetical protein